MTTRHNLHHADFDSARGWRTFSVTSIGATCQGIAATSPLLALPAMARDLGASAPVAAWFILAYPLTCATLILAFGRIADMVQRRTLYLVGMAVFAAGSVGAGLAPTSAALIVSRVVQGIGAAALMSSNVALLTDTFPRRYWGVALGSHVTVGAMAQVLGPVLGGAVSYLFGWRWVFLMLAPPVLLGLVWGLRMLVPMAPSRDAGRFDVTGALLSAVVLGSPVLAAFMAQLRGWSDPVPILLFVVAVVALVAFWAVERRARWPLVNMSLLARAQAGPAYLGSFSSVFVRAGAVTGMALLLQQSAGFSALHAGIVVAALALGMMVTAPLAGYWVPRVGARIPCLIGPVVAAIGVLGAFGSLLVDTSPIVPAASLALIGLGLGTFSPANTAIIMSSVSAAERGAANGIRQSLQVTGDLTGNTIALATLTHLTLDDSPFPVALTAALVGACVVMVVTSVVQRTPA